jgi:TonB-linked SusC/RagA family outer membrane protein
MDGKFSLSNLPKNSVLQISYIGYTTKFVPVTSSSLRIIMAEDAKQIDEVVVVGYGVQKKKLVTGATVSVKGDDLEKLSTTNALEALQGQAAGVNITSTSGQPGGALKVNIRGVGTIGNASPVYVVDGVMTGDITYLNNADIASIDVLKDAASCAIYGVNGANGVVLITTKGGSAGNNGAPKSQITFDTYYGLQNAARKVNVLNAPEYATMQNEAAINSGISPYFTQAQINAMGPGTNWQNAMFSNNVPTQNYNIAASGGNAASIYSMAFSYTDQGGIIGGVNLSDYQRYNFRVNTEHNMYGDFLKIGEHVTYSHINQKGIQDQGIYGNSIEGALSTSPFLAMYDSKGNFLNSMNSTFYNGGSWNSEESNPYAMMLYTNQNQTQYDKVLGDVYAEIHPIQNLKIKSTFGLDYDGSSYHSYTPTYYLSLTAHNTTESITQSSSTTYTWNWANTANYIFKKDNHNFDFLVGDEVKRYSGNWINGSNGGATLFGNLQNGYLSNSTITAIAASASTAASDKQTVTNSMSLTGNQDAVISHASFFGRLNYNYNETYMATVVMRADGSTMFAPGHQWGYFPSISAGWVMTNEKFMAPVKSWMDFLKIRAGWGTNGNDNIPIQFGYLSTISVSNATYNIGGADVPGSYPITIATPNLKWETSEQLNVGFDARFLNGKLNANFDLYDKTTKDWLLQAPVFATDGVSSAPIINGGNVTNKGIELQLSYNDKIGRDFKYTISASYTYNKNNVTNIPTEDGIIHGATGVIFTNGPEFNRAQAGHPIGYFWGYKTAGIFQTEAQIKAYVNSKGQELQPNAQPGDVIFVKTSNDGLPINADDKTDIGDPNPHHLFGANFSCSFKNFDLGITLNGVAGNKIAQSYRSPASSYGNWTTAILDRWHGPGTSNSMPRVTLDNSNWSDFSDLYLHDGSYLRVSNIQLGYDFAKMINCKYINQLRLYVAAQNLITFTKYNGFDPEVGYAPSSGNYTFGQGVDVGSYPHAQTFLMGLNVKF